MDLHGAAIKTKDQKRARSNNLYRVNNVQLYLMCLIPVLFVVVFNYLPMGGIIIAFKNYRYDLGIFGSEWVGLKNIEFFFRSDAFLKITWNTLYLNIVFMFTGMIASVLIAVMLYQLKGALSVKTFQTILITPNFLSWVVVAYMGYAILNPSYGWLNSLLVGINGTKIDWYSEPNAWPLILTIASVWKHMGMDSIIYYAALMGLNPALFEAAAIDGARKHQEVFRIILPQLMPLIIMLMVLKVGSIFRADFGLFYQLTRDVGTLYSTTDVIDTYIFRTMRVINDMGMSSAVGLLQSLVGFVLVIITNHLSKRFDPDAGLF